MTTTEQRRVGLGGSDISAIVGLSPYKTAFDVWALKTGAVSDPPPNKRMRMGKLLEQAIATGYIELSGNPEELYVEWCDETQVHPMRPWMLATPDAYVYKDEGFAAFLVCGLDSKNIALDQAHRWGPAGTDEVPQEIICQAQWYCEFEEIDRWDIAALMGGNDLRIYTVPRDKEIGAFLVDQGERWWKRHIVEGVQPEIGASEGARRFLRERFPRNVAEIRQATEEQAYDLRDYYSWRHHFDSAEKYKAEAENRIKLAIGDADGIQSEKLIATWKLCKDTMGTDWEKLARYLASDFDRSQWNHLIGDQLIAELESRFQAVIKKGSRRFNFKEKKQ